VRRVVDETPSLDGQEELAGLIDSARLTSLTAVTDAPPAPVPAGAARARSRARSRAEDDMLTFHIALKYFTENKTAQEVADELRLERSFVSRRIKEAKLRGMVHILVTPPVRVQELRGLERRLKSHFPLKEVTVIPGREDVMDAEQSADKESVLLACCQAAAQWLTDTLQDGDTLAVPWGRVASYLAGQLNPTFSLEDLITVPIVGVTGVTTHPFEANTVAARIASVFGGQSYLLAAPAVVTPEAYEVISQIPLVKRVLDQAMKADVVITPVTAAEPRTSTVVKQGLASPAEIRYLMERGAVGEIASFWWFDRFGRLVELPHARPIGLGLHGLADIVRDERKVVAVVAASRARIAPLRVALEQELVNVLITDQVTAQELLQDAP
jgi:DNA-binding transcriptional regulator LsrR (DeoR family)